MRTALLLTLAFLVGVVVSGPVNGPVNDGCTSSECQFIQGLLTGLGFPIDLGACLSDVTTALADFEKAGTEFNNRQYALALQDMATGFDVTATALSACQVEAVAHVVAQVAALLRIANITYIEGVVHIFVQDADVYQDLYTIATAIATKQWASAGSAIADLVLRLQAAQCTTPVCIIVEALLKSMATILPSVHTCVADLDASWSDFSAFAYDVTTHAWPQAVTDFSNGLLRVAGAIDDCGLPQVARIIAYEAQRLGLAKVVVISTTVAQILVDGHDVFSDVSQAALDLQNKNYADFGLRMADLVRVMESISCSDPACEIISGILQLLEIVVPDLGKCRATLSSGIADIQTGVTQFQNKQYGPAVASIARGLNTLGSGVSACGLPDLANWLQTEAKILGIANITIVGDVVQILAQGVDVYQDVYQACVDFAAKRYQAFGMDVAVLLGKLSSLGCKSPACTAVEAILKLLHVVIPDLTACSADLNAGWQDMEVGAAYFKQKQYGLGIQSMATGLTKYGDAVRACGVPEVGSLITEYAQRLFGVNITFIGPTVQILLEGVDIFTDIDAFANAMVAKDYAHAAGALASLIGEIKLLGCRTPACQILESMLEILQIVLQDVHVCETDLDGAMRYFDKAVADWDAKKYQAALYDIADSLATMGTAVRDCGVPELAVLLDNMAALLHFGQINLEAVVKMIVAGVDIYDEAYACIKDYEVKNWRAFGRDLGTLIKTLWDLSTHKCDQSPGCYVVEGILEALLVVPDWKACGADWVSTWDELVVAEKDFAAKKYVNSLKDLAVSGHDFSIAVQACDIEQLGEILEALAKKLGLGWASWIGDIVRLIVDGSEVFDEVYSLVEDIERKNPFGIGLDLARLIRTLIHLDANGNLAVDERIWLQQPLPTSLLTHLQAEMRAQAMLGMKVVPPVTPALPF